VSEITSGPGGNRTHTSCNANAVFYH